MIVAKEKHPIILATMGEFLKSLDELAEIRSLFPDCDIYNLTLVTSYLPFLKAFYRHSNQDNISIAFDPSLKEVNDFIDSNYFTEHIIEKIMMDFNEENFKCNNTISDKRFEQFISEYSSYDICIPNTTLGIDIGENSWNN
jgi:hypothetical protein